MNERIKEIIEQSGVKLNCYGKPIPASLASNFDNFVELFIKECVGLSSDMFGNETAASTKIKEYFGAK